MSNSFDDHLLPPSSDDEDDHLPPPDDETCSKESSKKRGLTCNHDSKKLNSRNGQIVVKYNRYGVPVGPEAVALSTYLGVLARTTVPIIYRDWRYVPEKYKEALWQFVKKKFVVDDKSRKQVLQAIAKSFRTFRYNLTKEVLSHMHDRKMLKKPPLRYHHIRQDYWEAFVNERVLEEFAKLRKQKQITRGYNKYNHCLSRKGYVGLLEEICAETGLTEDQIDRSITWIRGRKRKDGGYNPDVQTVVDMLLKAAGGKTEKSSSSYGNKDILAKTLRKTPVSGRLQGTGKYVSTSMYFHTPHNSQESERKIFEEWLEKHDADIELLWNEVRKRPRHSDIGSSNFPVVLGEEDDVVNMKGNEDMDCMDMVEQKKSKGTITDRNKVYVELKKEKSSPNFKLEEEEVNMIEEDFDKQPLSPHKKNKKDIVMPQRRRTRQETAKHKTTAAINPRFKFFIGLCELKLPQDGNYHVHPLDKDLFGGEYYTFIGYDDCIVLTCMEWLGVNHLQLYMAYLHVNIKEDAMGKPFGFMNPAVVSPTKPENALKTRLQRTQSISDRLDKVSSSQMIFIPYNPGAHWVLVVVDVAAKTGYYMDPLGNPPDEDIKELVIKGITMYAAMKTKRKVHPNLKIVQVPRQPGSYECGYYVMRYMKEIIADATLLLNNFNNKKVYSQEELDEVRQEWISYVRSIIFDQ